MCTLTKEATAKVTKCFITMMLSLGIILTASCGFGPYFLDDGTRLAHDAKTGEYIGERVGECKVIDPNTGKYITYYKIHRQDGSTIEVMAERVRLNKP